MPCSASRVRRVFKKKNTIPRGSRFRTEAHRQVERAQRIGNTAVCSWEHKLATDATRHFGRELPVRRENIFSRRGAACGQRVTTHKMSSRRDGLKSEEKRGRRKSPASSLLSECLACHAVLVSNILSRRRSRVRAMRPRPQNVIPESRTPDGRSAREGVGSSACENVFRSSVRAVSRIEVSRTETDTPSREESNCGNQRIQNEAPAAKTVDKN